MEGHSMNDCIFITGAGAGIGRATARLFTAADRDAEVLEALRNEL